MSTRRRRRNYSSGSGGGGGTSYTNAIHFATNTQNAYVAANAAIDDIAQFTVAVLARHDGTSTGNLVSKGAEFSAGWKMSATEADFTGYRATTTDFKRDTGIHFDNTWNWLFFSYNRSTFQVTRSGGPQGGTIADYHRGVTAGGAGAFVTDASRVLHVGFDGANACAYGMEIRFLGIAGSILSLANSQAIANDALAQSALFIDYWKPISSSTTQVNSGKSVLAPLIYVGATLV